MSDDPTAAEKFDSAVAWSDDAERSDMVGSVDIEVDGDEVVVSWRVEHAAEAAEMLRFNRRTKLVRVFPLTRQGNKFARDFDDIAELQLTMPWDDKPPTEVSEFTGLLRVEGLPPAFNPVFAYGLGVTRAYRGLLSELHERTNCSVIRFTKDGPEGADGDVFVIHLDRLEEYRRIVDRAYRRAGTARSRVIAAEAHNAVADLVGRSMVSPRGARNPVIGMLTEEIETGHVTTREDRAVLVNELARQAPQVAAESPEQFGRLREDLELVSLETLIRQYDAGLTGPRARDESHWQRFFTANPFALQQVFAAPILVVGDQVHVKGTNALGGESRITDFLCVNAVTRTAIAVEIKTPATSLMAHGAYRGERAARIYPTHKDLSGAVAQVQAQMESVSRHLKKHPSFGHINKWHVSGAVIIGRVEALDSEQEESFLRYREGLGRVTVLGFDEIGERLRYLAALLAEDSAPDDDVTAPR